MSIRIHFLAAAFIVFIPVNAHSATLTVGEGAEFNFSTISSAVAVANGGDTLLIAPGVYDATAGEVFPIVVEKTLSLVGASSAEVIVDATGSGARALRVDRPESFTMEGLTITGGASPFDGGGLYCQRTNVTLRNCTFRGNQSLEDGGALRLALCNNVLIEGCHFLNNQTPGQFTFTDTGWTGSPGRGGAIYASLAVGHALSLENCLFRGNTGNGSGHAFMMEGFGSELEIDGCLFEGNGFEDPRIYQFQHSMVVLPEIGVATIRNCRFTRNGAAGDSQPNLLGPYVITGDEVAFEHCSVSENLGYGGVSFATGAVLASEFNANQGIGIRIGGGSIVDSQIVGNDSMGIYSSGRDSLLRIAGSTLAANGMDDGPPQIPTARAGGVQVEYTSAFPLQEPIGRLEIESSVIQGNLGLDGSAGGVDCTAGEVVLLNSIVAGNTATGVVSAPGGMRFRGDSLRIANCSFNGNESTPPNSLEASQGAEVFLQNSIFWDGEESIMTDPGNTIVAYCAIEQQIPGEGNIYSDPQFLHPWDGEFADLRLPCDSPAVDAGTLEGAPTRDIEGVTRPRGSGVDMGAYENCHFDVNGDRIEDRRDLLSFSPHWYNPTDETNFGFDLDRLPPSTGRIDRLDLDQLLEAVK